MKKHTYWAVERDGQQRSIGATEARARCRAAGTTLRAIKRRAHQRGSFNPYPHNAPVGVGFGA